MTFGLSCVGSTGGRKKSGDIVLKGGRAWATLDKISLFLKHYPVQKELQVNLILALKVE